MHLLKQLKLRVYEFLKRLVRIRMDPGSLPSLMRREVAECAQWSVWINAHRPRLDPRSPFLLWLVCPWLAGTGCFYPSSRLEIVLVTLVQWTQWTAQSQDQCGVGVGH